MHLWVNYGCMVINFVYVHSNCTDMWQTHGSILDLIGNILPLNGSSPHSCILNELNFQNYFQANCLRSFDRWWILRSTQIDWQLNQIKLFTYLLIWGSGCSCDNKKQIKTVNNFDYTQKRSWLYRSSCFMTIFDFWPCIWTPYTVNVLYMPHWLGETCCVWGMLREYEQPLPHC